jgi:hypothetical protein
VIFPSPTSIDSVENGWLLPSRAAISWLIISTTESTTALNARARISPTAISMRLPFIKKSLNSFSTVLPPGRGSGCRGR